MSMGNVRHTKVCQGWPAWSLEHGCFVPALNCRQAVALAVMWDSHIDLIVVNPALNGIAEMIQTLSRVRAYQG